MATYYVATTGDNGNAGTIGSPWADWYYGFEQLVAGDILYIRGGTYTTCKGSIGGNNRYGVYIDNVDGTSGSHITVSNYLDEMPILDGSVLTTVLGSIIGLRFNNCSYWDLSGLEVINFYQHSDNDFNAEGMYFDGCDHFTLIDCKVHDCGDGFYMYVNGCDGFNFINCDSYDNEDRYTLDGIEFIGGLANGFYGAPQTGDVVSFSGCRAWSNSDDGWDMFGGGGFVTWTNCWAFSNGDGSGPEGHIGDGIGFKLGPVKYEAANQRVLYNCLSFDNATQGYDANQSAVAPYSYVAMKLYNCISYNNAKNFMFWWPSSTVIENCTSYANTGDADEFGAGTVETTNSWSEATVTDGDFVSISTTSAKNPRGTGGSLPSLTMFKLVAGSDLIAAGTHLAFLVTDGAGVTYANPPSIGPYEFNAANIPVTSVTVSGTGGASTITTDGGTLQMIATILPVDATDKSVTWSVINGTGAASITAGGLLTALSNGTVTVRATANG